MNDSRPGLAAIWMIGAMVSFTSMAVAGRYTSVELDTFELMLFRSLIGIVLVLVVGGALGKLGEISTKNMKLHVFRNLLHFTGQNLWFFALTVIPLAQLIALEFTTPLWVILIAPVFLGERLTVTKVLSVALGFIGILIVARPEIGNISYGVMAGAACAIGFAGAMLFTKLLTRSVTITCILFWLVTLQAIFGLIPAGWDGEITLPSAAVLPWVVVVAVSGLFAHLSITTALSLAPASIVGPIDFFRLPVVALVGMLVFNEALDALVFVGALLIFAGNFINLRSESRKQFR